MRTWSGQSGSSSPGPTDWRAFHPGREQRSGPLFRNTERRKASISAADQNRFQGRNTDSGFYCWQSRTESGSLRGHSGARLAAGAFRKTSGIFKELAACKSNLKSRRRWSRGIHFGFLLPFSTFRSGGTSGSNHVSIENYAYEISNIFNSKCIVAAK